MIFTELKYTNDIFKNIPSEFISIPSNKNISVNLNMSKFIESLRESKDVFERKFGNISSFNFTHDVFYSGKWNDLSKTARGLFINTDSEEIIARGYEKFFNYEEKQFNRKSWLKENLEFPVVAWNKYNGYLGLLGYDKTRSDNKLIFCSKSSPESDFANWFKEIFYNKINGDINEYIKSLEEYLDKENLCLIFEVIDPINDPHIIKYDNSNIVLLGALKRSIKFEEVEYLHLCKIAGKFGWDVKEKYQIFNNWKDLEIFIEKISTDMDSQVEGFVIEDQNKYMFKLKGKFYKTWKMLRGLKDQIGKGRTLKMGFAQTPLENYFIAWCKKQDRQFLLDSDIIKLRTAFFTEFKSLNL